VPPEGIRVDADIDLTGRGRCKNGDYMDASLGQALNTPAFNDLLVKLYQEFLPGLRTLVFCATIKHAEAIQAKFKQTGISAGLIRRQNADDERRVIIAAFGRAARRPSLSTSACSLRVVDIHAPKGCSWRARLSRRCCTRRFVGRVLRLSPGKVKATIVDVTGAEQTLFTLGDMLESPSYRQACESTGYRYSNMTALA